MSKGSSQIWMQVGVTRLWIIAMFCAPILTLVTPTLSSGDTSQYLSRTLADASELIGAPNVADLDGRSLWAGLFLNPSFSDSAKEIIQSATQLFIQNAISPGVLDCAMGRSKSQQKFVNEFKRKMKAALSLKSLGNGHRLPAPLFISRIWNEPHTSGLGYIDYYNWRDKPLFTSLGADPRRQYLYIALNSDMLGRESQFSLAQDAAYWAGIIAHEIAHNLGYRHPNGFKGTFISEYGQCIRASIYERAVESEFAGPDPAFEHREFDREIFID